MRSRTASYSLKSTKEMMGCIEFLIVLAMASLYFDTGVSIPVAHIQNQLDFLRSMLIWMPVRAMRAILQRVQCAVIALHPAVNVLPVGVITHRSLCNTYRFHIGFFAAHIDIQAELC